MRISDWSSDVCSSDLLPAPAREGSGYRRYESHDVSRLHFVRRAKALGFTLGEIRELLAPSTPRHGDMAAIKEIGRASCRERVCQYVSISVVAVSLKTKKNQHTHNKHKPATKDH